jgi:hypothetical protein
MEQLQRPATTRSRRVGRRRCSFLSMEPVAGLRRVERTQAEGPIQIRGHGFCKYVDPDKDLLVNTDVIPSHHPNVTFSFTFLH